MIGTNTLLELRRGAEMVIAVKPLRSYEIDPRLLLILINEIERLREGRLTPEEFNELCHNLHERGTPITREEHTTECEKFRNELVAQNPG